MIDPQSESQHQPQHIAADTGSAAACGVGEGSGALPCYRDTPEDGQQPEPRSGKQPSFAALARRITGWTSNLAATAMVVLLCLGVGRTLLDWNRREPEAITASPGADLDTAAIPLTVEFPHTPNLRRTAATGDREAIRAELRQRIVQATKNMAADAQRRQAAARRVPGDTESQLLALAQGRAAAVAEPGRWEVHEFIGTFPLWVGFVQGSSDAGNEQTVEKANRAGDAASSAGLRLAAWGMAVPSGGDRWNLYLQESFQPEEGSGDSAGEQPGSQAPPLPRGCHRTLALGAGQGQRMIGFAGEATADDCRAHFDRWAGSLDPPQTFTWYGEGNAWVATLQMPPTNPTAAARGLSIRIQLSGDPRGGVLGLISLQPLQAPIE